MGHTLVHPKGWPRPRGYAHGIVATGRLLVIAGQIGSRTPSMTLRRGFIAQFEQALDNVLAVTRAAGGQPTDVISLTVFVTSKNDYNAATRALGRLWRARFGRHYPAMTLVEVSGLVEAGARVEIQGLAAIA